LLTSGTSRKVVNAEFSSVSRARILSSQVELGDKQRPRIRSKIELPNSWSWVTMGLICLTFYSSDSNLFIIYSSSLVIRVGYLGSDHF
jgi:hypothetical protein